MQVFTVTGVSDHIMQYAGIQVTGVRDLIIQVFTVTGVSDHIMQVFK